ncbi:MAG: TMEM165/GDT1 family protein [Magnetococcales bacterium]|nr:TMEM165/GDT1 family protein [Magnetococcales bacterium]
MSTPIAGPDWLAAGAWLTPLSSSFGLIFLAELGDKSQLVCMALAARHRPGPVLLGAMLAFLLLNTLAVVFGAGLMQVVPERVLAGVVAALFAFFGLFALLARRDAGDEAVRHHPDRGGAMAAFLLIFLAEMGDKTQLAVAGLATTLPVVPVWLGATLALTAAVLLGVLAGRNLLTLMPLPLLQRISGLLFLAMAGLALTRVF